MNLFAKWLKSNSGKKTKARGNHRRTAALRLEQLEVRIAPIVGKNVIPAPVVAGGPYDGVVMLQRPTPGGGMGTGSGALIAPGNGHYILTAAHVNPGGVAGTVTFNVQRADSRLVFRALPGLRRAPPSWTTVRRGLSSTSLHGPPTALDRPPLERAPGSGDDPE